MKFVRVEDVRCGKNKIKVCHKSGRRSSELCISAKAVAAHLAHGDVLGDCHNSWYGNDRNRVNPDLSSSALDKSASTSAVFPNPTRSNFTLQISLKQTGKAQVEVLNANGSIVERRNIQLTGITQKLEFDLHKQPAGIYLIKVSSDAEIQTHKIVVQR